MHSDNRLTARLSRQTHVLGLLCVFNMFRPWGVGGWLTVFLR